MMRPLLMLVIGLFFGGGIGFLVAASQGVELEGHDHSNPAHHTDGMDHGGHAMHMPIDLPVGNTAPTMSANLVKDTAAGWNLHIATTQFQFAPEQVNGDHIAGQGHAHVYVNGAKIARLYGPWMHIAHLPAGDVTVTVELNANDHSPLSVGGVPLRQDIMLTVQ